MGRQVADDVQSIIGAAIEARGEAFIALPGGGTPVPIFAELAARAVHWSLVTLLPTDYRMVPVGDPLSNAGLIRSHFGGTNARRRGPRGRRACGVTPDPRPAEAPVPRVTLTRAALVATRVMMLTITGEAKRVVAQRAIRDASSSSLAIGQVLASAGVPVVIYWSP